MIHIVLDDQSFQNNATLIRPDLKSMSVCITPVNPWSLPHLVARAYPTVATPWQKVSASGATYHAGPGKKEASLVPSARLFHFSMKSCTLCVLQMQGGGVSVVRRFRVGAFVFQTARKISHALWIPFFGSGQMLLQSWKPVRCHIYFACV